MPRVIRQAQDYRGTVANLQFVRQSAKEETDSKQ